MDTLKTLAGQVERQRQLRVLCENLSRQIEELNRKAELLRVSWAEEEADVEQLNKGGLTALFYALLGKKEEKLEQEKREALAAAAKFRSAEVELEAVHGELAQLREEMAALQGCEIRFEEAKKRLAAEWKETDPVNGPVIAALEAELGKIDSQRQELREAVRAGEAALETARQVQKELDKAAGWGTWDLLGGGGLITQMAKHEHLDTAQNLVNHLQSQLRRFKTELADVEIHADLSVQINDFLRFADWFFDGLIVDWTVQDKIEEALDQIYHTACQIQTFLDRLDSMKTILLRREDEAKNELETLLMHK